MVAWEHRQGKVIPAEDKEGCPTQCRREKEEIQNFS